jgi:hypothetical protein
MSTVLENFKIGNKVSEKETTNNSVLLFFKHRVLKCKSLYSIEFVLYFNQEPAGKYKYNSFYANFFILYL